MNNAWTLATNGFAAGWGGQMLRACAQGTLLAAFVWLLCRFVPRLSAATRAWLWWLVCLKLLLGLFWVAPVALPLLPAPKRLSTLPHPVFSGMNSGFAAGAPSSFAPPNTQGADIQPALPVRHPTPAIPSSLSLTAIGLGLWLVGMVFRFGGAFRQLLVVSRLTRRASPLQTAEINTTASQIAERLGLGFVPGLRVSEESLDPLAVGPLRPQVVIAQATLDRLTPEELRSLLAHEFAHIRRGDLWLGIIPLLAENLFFFFPPVWLACREFAVAREAACDAAAVQVTDTPSATYGRLLLKLGELRADLCPTGALAATSNFHMLQRRIVMLQDISRMSGRRLAGGVFAFSLIAMAGLVPWRLVAAQEKSPPEKSAQANASAPTEIKSTTAKNNTVASYNPGSHTDWSQYPTEPMNLDFKQGTTHWAILSESKTSDKYRIGVDLQGRRPGYPAAYLESRTAEANGDGDLTQKFRTNGWRGKRVRFSAYVKTEGVTQGAGAVLHQDQPENIHVWGGDQLLRGTTGWTRREIVADVPADSQGFIFGVFLIGRGKVWIDDPRFEEVGKDVPVSKLSYSSDDSEEADSMTEGLPTAPVNPDFKKGLEGWDDDNPDHTTYKNYRIGLDSHEKRNGIPSAYLTNKVEKPHNYGTLMQNINPKEYRGKRVRLSADMKTQDVENYAGMWLVMMRANKQGDAWHSAMNLKGSTDWTHYSYVVDVPEDANFFSFGLALEDRGKIWVNPFHLEVVGNDVPVTPPSMGSSAAQWKGNTARVVALWQLGRTEKYAELKAAAEAIVHDTSALPEEQATAREALAYALNALHDTEGAKHALDQFEQEAKSLTLDTGVIAEAKRLRAGLK